VKLLPDWSGYYTLATNRELADTGLKQTPVAKP
jgi:hypothetical protein